MLVMSADLMATAADLTPGSLFALVSLILPPLPYFTVAAAADVDVDADAAAGIAAAVTDANLVRRIPKGGGL